MLKVDRSILAKTCIAFAVALMACNVAQGQDVRYNFMPGTDFSKYHT